MLFDKVLKIGLLFGAALVGILAVLYFGLPQFLIGLVLLAALVEFGLGQYVYHPESGDHPAIHD
jgi:hypothetical protein